ncbi:DUF927 domain-containing protein [Paenibacillus agricola]|uniref:DUF927 domain-containing protein n=1 Tax=Paenibacillus agricola TaxID=2716264 RepID=A0ABX0JAY1_9BACL|nr:DUF927 domain-containing protein [Paenibacillus agricola]NHN33569.1 DUF927 domain-containing protein [Paenibacillus agricola]
MEDRELDISFGKHRTDISWKIEYLAWGEFVDRLRKVRRTAETMAQYDKMDKAKRGKIKDGICFVGGLVRGGRRKKESIDTRSLLALDVDRADDDFLFSVELVLGGSAYVIYSTHSYRPDEPKYRLVVLPNRNLSPDEYAAISRKLAEQIGMDYFDKTTFDVHRLMYLPSCSKDAEPVLEVYEGEPLDIDKLLGEYKDWRDPLQWPRHADDKIQRHTSKRMEDPRAKRGIVGLFCRCFSISDAITTFLPDKYDATDESLTRYTYAGSSSFGGLVVYDEDTFAFSHHESDPCSGREVNAFDLVRLHMFGDLDEGLADNTNLEEKPSQVEMKRYAAELPEVKKISQEESSAEMQEAFADAMETDSPTEGEHQIDISNVRIPSGFKVMDGKIFEVRELKNDIKHIPICDCMVAITARYVNLTDNTHGLEVSWKINDWLRTVSDSRSTFMDSKKIINLSDYGLPVHSGNARNLAGYLSRFETENEQTLVTKKVSNQLGWTKGGFLLGEQFIGKGAIQFQPGDAGDGQTAKGFHTKGTMEGTLDVLNKVQAFAAVKMAMYAALSAPLLERWGESPYIFELAGGTSRGKTTAMRIAASLFGCPDEQKPGFFKQWNLTRVSIERYAATMNNLPLFIDDTKKADIRIVPGVIYQFCSGQSKGRGSLKGSQAGVGWCTVMLSTGEQKLTSFSKDGGAAGRILSLEGPPFASTDVETAKMIDGLNKQVSEHYGHVAEPWIRFLQTTDMKNWKKKFAAANDKYLQLARGAGEVAMRISKIMAIVDVVGEMFDLCFGLSLYAPSELRNEWLQIIRGATELDQAAEAVDAVMGWVASKNKQFVKNGMPPYAGDTLGELKKDEAIVIATNLNDFLRSHGYEPHSITKAWKEKGWLNTDTGRTQKSPRIAGVGNTRTYNFNLSKLGWSFDIPDRFAEFGED